jgi:hypothetical protein
MSKEKLLKTHLEQFFDTATPVLFDAGEFCFKRDYFSGNNICVCSSSADVSLGSFR